MPFASIERLTLTEKEELHVMKFMGFYRAFDQGKLMQSAAAREMLRKAYQKKKEKSISE